MPMSLHSSLPDRALQSGSPSVYSQRDAGSKTGAYYLQKEQALRSGRVDPRHAAAVAAAAAATVGRRESPTLGATSHSASQAHSTFGGPSGTLPFSSGRTSAPPLLPSTPPLPLPLPQAASYADDAEYVSVQRSNKTLLDTLTKARQVPPLASTLFPQPR